MNIQKINKTSKLIISYITLFAVLLLALLYYIDVEAQELSFFPINDLLDLESDIYYKDLEFLHPGKVSKFIDGYGVVFYAVDCWNDCKSIK